MMRLGKVLPVIFGLGIPFSAGAQSLPLAVLRDSVAHLQDVRTLLALEARSGNRSADERVARGLVALRLYELTGDPRDVKRAQEAFDSALRVDPDHAWAHFGLGLRWARDPELRQVKTPRIVTLAAAAAALHLDVRARARRSLERALQLDATLTPAAQTLVEIASHTRERDALEHARATLLRALEFPNATVDTRIAFAKAVSVLGDVAAGASALEPVVAGPRIEEAQLLRAELLLRTNGREEDGARAWFNVLQNLSEAGAARLFSDVADLLSAAERDEWKRLNHTARRSWLTRFWDARAALAGVSVPERMAEHYRRVTSALDRYPRQVRYGAPPRNALLLPRPDSRFDDRGIIYVRHGEPLRMIRTPHLGSSLQENESWLYDTPEGGIRMMHFAHFGELLGRGDAYPEFLLVHQVPCNADYVADRARYDARFTPFVHRCSATDRLMMSANVRGDAFHALRSDSHRPPFGQPLPFAYEWHSFRAAGGVTELVAMLALTGSAGEPGPVMTHITLAVVDTVRDRVTTTNAATESDRAVFSMLVNPAAHAVQRITVRDATNSDHGGFAGGPLKILDFSRDTLMLSDLLLGIPAATDAPHAWQRGDLPLDVLPGREFGQESLRVYYEIYNLTENARYQTEIVVERVRGGLSGLFGGGQTTRLRFDEIARLDGRGQRAEVRDIHAAWGAGRWRLRITVTETATGHAVRRERVFSVIPAPDRGAQQTARPASDPLRPASTGSH